MRLKNYFKSFVVNGVGIFKCTVTVICNYLDLSMGGEKILSAGEMPVKLNWGC